MRACLDAIANEGTAREVTGNSPLLLVDPESAWLVTAGRVDVFAVPLRGGEPAGARVHLCRVEAGQLLFGMSGLTSVAVERMGLVAAGGPDCRVVQVPRSRLGERAGDAALAGSVAALVDGWVEKVTAGVARDRLAKKVTPLEAGPEKSVETAGAITPARGVLWVAHAGGSSQFLGRKDLVLTISEGPFPLAGPGWLEVAAETRLTALPTADMLAHPRLWAGLDRLHQAVLTCVAARSREAAAAEHDRLRRRAEADRRRIQEAVSRLAAVSRQEEVDGTGPEPEKDPLLAACRLVGERLGLTIQAPLSAVEHRRRSDPVSAIARASRVRIRRVVLAGDWWRQDNGPLLAFRGEDEQPVALLPTGPSTYELVDPVTRARTPVTADGAAGMMPFGYCFYRPFEPRALRPWDLFRFGLAGSRRDWLVIVLLGLAGGLLGLAAPLATGWIFDQVIPGAQRSQLLLLVLALAASAAASALFQLTQSIAVMRVETRMDAGVETALWDRLLNLPVPFFRDYTAGDLADRAMGIATIRQILTDVVLSALLTGVFSLLSFALLFYYDVRLALLACALFTVVVLTTWWAARVELRYQRRLHAVRGKIAGLVLQLITGISRLRVAGTEGRALAVWARDFASQRRLAFQTRSVGNNLAAFNAAVPVVTLMALFTAVLLLPAGSLSLGAFLAFTVAFGQVLAAALVVSGVIGSLIEMVPLYERARPILETLPEVDPAKADPGDLEGDIEISHLSFRYHADGPLILNDVSLHVRPGEFVAFVGPSGAGKSTLLRLLLGFEAPTSGSIYYDRGDLAGLDQQAVRRQIGVVLQNSRIMAEDIFTNIIGSSLLTLDDAWEAARLSGLDRDIEAMPMGMHTVLSEGEGTLSGGQRQRLLIARAVVARPLLLFFDEATSALDNATQARVSQSLESLKATRVVVAHRLSTIVNADRIFVLEGGRVVQQGSYRELIGQEGLFADLVKRQLL